MALKKSTNDRPEQLAKRTIQILGFGFSFTLAIVKLGAEIINGQMLDIPWYVILSLFVFGIAPSLAERYFKNGK